MKKYKDITNQRFGNLLAIKRIARIDRKTLWLFKCDCGNEIILPLAYVTSGDTKSCGCYRKKVTSVKGKESKKHGMVKSRLYSIWSGMKQRCYNNKKNSYKYYGNKNIIVCENWKNNFMSFYNWAILNGYNATLTIDRIDLNGNYEPQNCRWATIKEQNNNTSKNHWIEYNNEKLTMAQFAEKYEIPYDIVRNRIRYNWSIDRIVNTPFKCKKRARLD